LGEESIRIRYFEKLIKIELDLGRQYIVGK